MAFSVLIADDEPLERQALSDIVDQERDPPIQVYVARSGTEASKILQEHRIDVAFLDIRMPGRSGLAVAEELRRNGSSIAIVFITAFDYFEYAQSAIRLHAEDYLVKPVEDEVIRRILARLIDRRGTTPAPSMVSPPTTERFSEVARFLEQELLDDVIAGDIDRADLAAAFELLGYAGVTGVALLVCPDLSRYPFRLETDAQRRTVVQRALRAVEHAIARADARFLRRAHRDVGYLVVLSPDLPGNTPVPPEVVASARQAVLDQTALPVTILTTDTFAGIASMSRTIRAARLHLSRLLEVDGFDASSSDRSYKSGRVSLLPSPGHERAIDSVELQMLQALLHADAEHMRRSSEALWGTVTANEELDTTAGLRDRLNRTLGFLLRSARNRGIPTPPEEGVLLGSHHATRRELRVAFLESTGELVQQDLPLPIDTFTRRTTEFLHRHYARDIGLSDLASYLGMSESHCSREVTRHYGRPFRRVLRETRLQVAQRLLGESALAIRDVAEQAGFRDPNYFSRVFQESFGMSPREYRDAVGS